MCVGVSAPLCSVAQSSPTLWDPMDCSPPGSSGHRILWERILEWVSMPVSRGSSQPRDQTQSNGGTTGPKPPSAPGPGCQDRGHEISSSGIANMACVHSCTLPHLSLDCKGGTQTWRRRHMKSREGGGHQPRDGRPEPLEAGRGGEDPPLEPLQGAQLWDPLTSDV